MKRASLFVVGLVLVFATARVRAEPEEHGSAEAAAAHEADGHEGGSEAGHEAPAAPHEGDDHAAAAAPHEGDDHEGPMPTGLEEENDEQMEDSGVDPDEEAAEEEEAKEDGAPAFNEFDEDGDGVVSPEEKADEAEFEQEFKGIPAHIDTDAADTELEARAKEGKAMLPSITPEHFRKAVAAVKKIVLARIEKKMEKKQQAKMAKFGKGVSIIGQLGWLLLFMPLFLIKRYPGKGGLLFKYSALAAFVFVVTINLFGGVLMVMRGVQGGLAKYTDPQIAIVTATFDTLDHNAEEYAVMGKELFMPTIEALRGNTDEQPVVMLLQNGQKIVKDAMVFVSVAKMVKKVSFIFEALPIVMLLLTMFLFVKAIRPTLTEIVKLPIRVASGEAGPGAGREVVRNAWARVRAEGLATLCTLGVLSVLTIVSSMVLGAVVEPAIDSLIRYFSLCITYLQYADGASSGTVFMTLFAVIFFLVLNLAALILSMSFFLGKAQKIFQARFQRGVPLAEHKPYFKWAIPAVLYVQLFPLLFALIADKVLGALDSSARDGVTDPNAIAWGKTLLAGPTILVAGFIVLFWAAQGVRAIKFLFKYKVK